MAACIRSAVISSRCFIVAFNMTGFGGYPATSVDAVNNHGDARRGELVIRWPEPFLKRGDRDPAGIPFPGVHCCLVCACGQPAATL